MRPSEVRSALHGPGISPAFAEAPARRTRLWQAGLRAGREFGIEAKNIKLQILKISFHNLHSATCIEEEPIRPVENGHKLL